MKGHLKAKAIGGGNGLKPLNTADNFTCVGEINIRFLHEFLQTEKIPPIADDLGGDRGRVIHAFSRGYSVHVRKVPKSISTNVARQEKDFWKQSIQKHQTGPADIQLWN